MRNTKSVTDLKDQNFGSNLHLELRRNRTGPRLKIRQLLRSFAPLNRQEKTVEKSVSEEPSI